MGIIGYEFVSEITPFHDDNVHETYSKILSHAESTKAEELKFPSNVHVSEEFKNLINRLVIRQKNRLNYSQIVRHSFFANLDWNNLRNKVPPIIPTVMSDDDTSNFEDVDKKGRRSTFLKASSSLSLSSGKDFSGFNLPFIGYSYVKDEQIDPLELNISLDSSRVGMKVGDLQRSMKSKSEEMNKLKDDLLQAQKKAAHAETIQKIHDKLKSELNEMKSRIEEKTRDLAATKTEVKTLRSALKIEEELRVKNENHIAEVLSSTYQKWEKSKKLSDQNYEKLITDKKTALMHLNEKLASCESELQVKSEECMHLQDSLKNYKEMLRNSKSKIMDDKAVIEKSNKELITAWESKIEALKNKAQQEKEIRCKLSEEVHELKAKLNEMKNSKNHITNLKQTTDKNIDDMKSRLSKEIEENRELREIKATAERECTELQKKINDLKLENTKLGDALNRITDNTSQNSSLQFRSAQGSMQDINWAGLEEQLRNELMTAKENEVVQRKRAENLQEIVARLEDVINRFEQQPKSTEVLLEKQNEKLEDQLTHTREQLVIERQSARTANLNLWKLEKQLDEVNLDKKNLTRRHELIEEKYKKSSMEKEELNGKIRELNRIITGKEEKIKELLQEISELKENVRGEHKMWKDSENELVNKKSEVLNHMSQIHKLEDIVSELRRKLQSLQNTHDSQTLEIKKLRKGLEDERQQATSTNDEFSKVNDELDTIKKNYNLLKQACQITETQMTEMEELLATEFNRNKESSAKIDDLWQKLRAKDNELLKLKQSINEEKSLKLFAETKASHLQTEIDNLKSEMSELHDKLKSTNLNLEERITTIYTMQEKLEVITSESCNYQRLTTNYEQEVLILKEENARVLTDLYKAKEENNKLVDNLELAQNEIEELRYEISELNNSLMEQKNYYVHRDIKSEATLAQHKKLIDYLQVKIEELSQKKKKTLADVLFGSNSTPAKKENLPPGTTVEGVVEMKRIQEDLRRERSRNNQLKEQLMRLKLDMRKSSFVGKSIEDQLPKEIEIGQEIIEKPDQQEKITPTAPPAEFLASLKKKIDKRNSIERMHRFELKIDSSGSSGIVHYCSVCNNQLIISTTHWRCIECKDLVHRKCRGGVQSICGNLEPITIGDTNVAFNENLEENDKIEYAGDILLRLKDFNDKLIVNTLYALSDNILLLGCTDGLYSYHSNEHKLVHIKGLKSVNLIAIKSNISKCLIIGNASEDLYQVDTRHLQNRAQSSAMLKLTLEFTELEIPFANKIPNERWYNCVVHSNTDNLSDAMAIAATTSRIVILRYDMGKELFKPVRALDSATPVSSILFTKHTAIVGSDKFFEIDLDSYAAEEFVDMSDATMAHTENSSPMAAFQINSREYLLCFRETGIFVDEFGCRSRPKDLNWSYEPLEFIYQEPFLYVSHQSALQIFMLMKSYTNSIAKAGYSEDDTESDVRTVYLKLSKPVNLTPFEMVSICLLKCDSKTEGREVLIVNGKEAFKAKHSNSLETFFSSTDNLSMKDATSLDTLATHDTAV